MTTALPYTYEELEALGLPLTMEETKDKLAGLREAALKHEKAGRLIAAVQIRRQILDLEQSTD